ncbi:MAG: FadR family transcriptional regulator, partial [Clostridiales bacterium]|nr:FadR family transcriptional regulator [Clostridiales bacterium]
AAGDRLPAEAELCRSYDVSRVTVRESLKKLQMMDVISIEQGRGTFVKGVNLGSFMKPMFNLIDFGDFDIATIYDARLYIEAGTSRLAALNRTPEDLETLSELLDRMRDLQGMMDKEGYVVLNGVDARFHIHVAAASRNEILKAAVVNLETISAACVQRLGKAYAVLSDWYDEHLRIFEAIRDGDADQAERAMIAHTLKSEEILR